MNAADILAAIRRRYPSAAVVPELTIEDYDLPDTGQETDEMWHPGAPRPDEHRHTRRIDALMFESLLRTAIEIKVTRADFMRDTYWKRRAWQRVTHRFVYAVPADLDVMSPHGCGLWKVHPDGRIDVVTKSIVSKTPDALPQTVVQRLAFRAASINPGLGGTGSRPAGTGAGEGETAADGGTARVTRSVEAPKAPAQARRTGTSAELPRSGDGCG